MINARPAQEDEELQTPGEVARLFGVHPKTVARWAQRGELDPLHTLGGHRRYRKSDVERLLRQRQAAHPAAGGPSA